jgi:hypothetical protein
VSLGGSRGPRFPSAGRLERKLNCRYVDGTLTLRAFLQKNIRRLGSVLYQQNTSFQRFCT